MAAIVENYIQEWRLLLGITVNVALPGIDDLIIMIINRNRKSIGIFLCVYSSIYLQNSVLQLLELNQNTPNQLLHFSPTIPSKLHFALSHRPVSMGTRPLLESFVA